MIRNKIIFFISFYILKIVFSNEVASNLQNFNTNESYNTNACINNILTKYFPCGTLTTFVNPNINMDQLIKITNGANLCHNIIVRSFDDRNWYIWTNVYVITADDLLTFWSGMLDMTKDMFWNPKAKFIVQVNNLNDDIEGIQEVFKILLKYRIYNVVVLQNLKEDAIVYTYHPFQNQNCGKSFDKVIPLGTCTNANIIDYYPNKIPKDLKNCNIHVVASEDLPNFISLNSNYTVYGKYVSGLEQFVLETIAAREGFMIKYEVFDEDETYGIVLPNGTATGVLSYIDRDKADIACGGYILMENRVKLFDYVWGFNYAAYYLYTPAKQNQIWQRVYREFGTSTWLLIGATLCYVTLVCVILKRLWRDYTFSVLNLWGYFFGNANAGLSKNNKFKMIMFFWTWFTYFISNFYNTALCSLTSVHVHEKPHSLSVGNLKSLPYKPCISDNTRLFFEYAYNQSLPEHEEYIHECTHTDSSLEYVAAKKQYYAIEMEYSYQLNEFEYISETGKSKLEPWLFSSTNVIVMYLVRGFPFVDKFQDYANRMYEAGLIINHLNTLNLRSYSVVQKHPKPFQKITVYDLKVHFLILAAGYVLSFGCFLLEVWYNYIKKEMKIKKRMIKYTD